VPIAAALAGAVGPDLLARLRVLAEGAPATGVGQSQSPRQEARAILNSRRYKGSPVPQPLHGPLAWLGREISHLGHHLRFNVPATQTKVSGFWLIVGLILAVVVLVVVLRLMRGRGGLRVDRAGKDRDVRIADDDPRSLDELADDAERAGDLDSALRLRFRAGLLRLARMKAIPARSSVTTREVRRALRSSEFDGLARSFDEVAYGRRSAGPTDLQQARHSWPRVLDAARSN
jgi:hypothetical protein